jgi:mono/diheme cytochrome c family protein
MKRYSFDTGSSLPRALLVLVLLFGVAGSGCEPPPAASSEAATVDSPRVVSSSPIEAGRYLAIVGGCNDCHTEGYLQTEGNVPEEEWLKGSALGWRGPWGTTYPPNLRLTVTDYSEDEWVTLLRERKALPPMPWMNLNQMSETDARALFQYIQFLGPAGERMPAAVPPDQEPTTPYLSLAPIEPGGAG